MNNELKFQIQNIKLIVGLGNLGQEYENTRHNVGFLFLDKLAGNKKFLEEKKLKAQTTETSIGGNKLILVKPTTFMNSSGEAVQLVSNYYKIKPDEILIVHDDLDIEFGEYKLQFKKGPKIHNGILSIQNKVGNDEFWRLRIGVDNREPELRKNISGADYVLGRLKIQERETLDETFDNIITEYF